MFLLTIVKYISKNLVVWSMFELCLWKIYLYTVHPTEAAFMVRDITSINSIFSIFSLIEHIKLMVYLKTCQWVLKQVFHDRDFIHCLIPIPIANMAHGQWSCTFILKKLQLYCVWDALYTKVLLETFKDSKWSINTFSQKINVTPFH